MIDADSLPAELLANPVLDGPWTRLVIRSDGTTVYRVEGRRSCYVKVVSSREPDDQRCHPYDEAKRLRWLDVFGLPTPDVVDVGADETTMWLVTTAVEGRPAAGHWSPADRTRVVDIVAELARALHALPLHECPFDRTLARTLPLARRAVELGRVDIADLEPAHRGWSARRLLAELDATPVPWTEDLVICHGDLCLDNVLVSPDATAPTGLIDVGRLGRADRWVDLAVATRNIADECAEWGYGPDHAERFLQRYGIEPDTLKDRFYRLIDEFV